MPKVRLKPTKGRNQSILVISWKFNILESKINNKDIAILNVNKEDKRETLFIKKILLLPMNKITTKVTKGTHPNKSNIKSNCFQ